MHNSSPIYYSNHLHSIFLRCNRLVKYKGIPLLCCDMEAGELVHVIADCHIYDRHVPVIKELISRTPYPAPTVKLNPNVKNFYDFTTDDLIVENYQTWPQIKNIPIAI